MMMNEFESRTGIYPSQDLYRLIEDAYIEGNLDKDTFCESYKNNENGIAEAIALKASLDKITAADKSEETISELKKEITHLKAQIEKEQEWKSYESDNNVKQSAYDDLATNDGTRILSDEEAKDLIVEEFGFDRSKITIHHSVAKEEVCRHRYCRKVGEFERLPIYNATDWNYIRFDCACWYYEMHNGQLCQFYC